MMATDGAGDAKRCLFGNYWLGGKEYPSGHNRKRVQNVWECNVVYEIARMKEVSKEYPYIALDTEYPGNIFISRPGNQIPYYIYTRDNTNVTKLIQLGLTFMNEKGELASGPYHTWQFNFRFNLQTDAHAPDSITLLCNAGFDFQMHATGGICHHHFAALLLTSGMLGNNQLTWILFQGNFDLGYLVRMFIGYDLPASAWQFLLLVKQFFPRFFDVKLLMSVSYLHGGLDALAALLNIAREGTAHQAGSDAMLTGKTFFILCRMYFGANLENFSGCIYGFREKYLMNGPAASNYMGPAHRMPKSED